MFSRAKQLLLLFLLLLCAVDTMAQQRRPVDAQHPLWLVHVDVWNQADPRKIIALIPDDIKPYVCMNLSLSCAYDVDQDVYIRPQNYLRTYKSWASVCQAEGLWFTCQPASGGHTHIMDNDLETFEYFFKTYPNFLGWNYAEQFWGFDEAGDKSSSSLRERIALFAKLIPMHHEYGGFLTISFCGNIWSHPLNPVGMMKSNADLLNACKTYPDAILWLYKYTTSSCFYNNESVSFGPFVAGLAKNYGVRYDNCGWNGALSSLLGDNHGKKYPVAAGIGTVMEQTGQNGGAVWDGPELIWTEDFQNLANTTVDGFTQRNWGTFPGFRNAWMDMFRKILDGTLYIPTREEVVEQTKVIVLNDVTSGSDEDKYASWGDLYDGLYKQNDPFNKDNGQWMNNYLYLKSTGRYGAIPIAPCLNDQVAAAIPNKVKKSQRTSVWPSIAKKQEMFNNAYPEVSTGDLFVSRFKNQLITYTPYSYLNSKTTATANVPLKYNTCESLDLTWGKLSSGLIREYADSITFYLNNYRTDTTANVKDVIIIKGAKAEPTYKLSRHTGIAANIATSWDAATGDYTITLRHNGPLDLTVWCAGNATDRSSDVAPSAPLTIPQQPEPSEGPLIIEAEDMNYRSVQSVQTTPYYSNYNWVRGHAGNGFIDMGTNTNGALTTTFKAPKAGDYKIAIRYSNTSKAGYVRFRVNNGSTITKKFELTEKNQWRKDTIDCTLSKGDNTFLLLNNTGVGFIADQVTIFPAEMKAEQFAVNLREVEHATVSSTHATAEEGEKVVITLNADENYELVGWNIIHGNIELKDEGNDTYSFVMPDDQVTLLPILKDASVVYVLDYSNVISGNIPVGWRATQGTDDVHEYPNSYGQGARTMVGFSGTYPKALYWRIISADYGKQADYRLTLQPGDYQLSYAMAAWKGTPECKAQILDASGKIVAQDGFATMLPNANGNSSADLSSATKRQLKFKVTTAGNYVINFLNNGTGFSEFLLAACQVNKVSDPTAIQNTFIGEQTGEYRIYNLKGVEVPSLQKGVNIIRFDNGTIKKVFVK